MVCWRIAGGEASVGVALDADRLGWDDLVVDASEVERRLHTEVYVTRLEIAVG